MAPTLLSNDGDPTSKALEQTSINPFKAGDDLVKSLEKANGRNGKDGKDGETEEDNRPPMPEGPSRPYVDGEEAARAALAQAQRRDEFASDPLHPEVQKLRDDFWDKHEVKSLRQLLLADQNKRVLQILIGTTAVMFIVPVAVMLLTQYFLPANISDDTKWVLGAVSAVVSVNIILGVFSYVAYCDESKNWADKQRLKQKSDQEWDDRIKAREAAKKLNGEELNGEELKGEELKETDSKKEK